MQTDSNDNFTINTEPDNDGDENLLDDDSTSQVSVREKRLNLDDIELKVNIVAGHLNLSLSELQSLKRGGVFDLGELPPTVKLVINDVVIGIGYLVEFNGRVGVKITDMNHNSIHNADA